jgi:hypothetical protein
MTTLRRVVHRGRSVDGSLIRALLTAAGHDPAEVTGLVIGPHGMNVTTIDRANQVDVVHLHVFDPPIGY